MAGHNGPSVCEMEFIGVIKVIQPLNWLQQNMTFWNMLLIKIPSNKKMEKNYTDRKLRRTSIISEYDFN